MIKTGSENEAPVRLVPYELEFLVYILLPQKNAGLLGQMVSDKTKHNQDVETRDKLAKTAVETLGRHLHHRIRFLTLKVVKLEVVLKIPTWLQKFENCCNFV